MSIPKSVVKISYKQGNCTLTYTDSVDRVNYTLEELIRRANIDVGRYLTRIIRAEVRKINQFAKKGKYIPQRYQYWARKKENDLQIGVENTNKGADSAWWADQSELGTNGQPKRAIIYNTVKAHISEIRDIQGQYLSAIEDEQKAIKLAEEAEKEQDQPDTMSDE